MQTQMIRRGCEILVLTLVYYFTARLGLLLAIPPGYAAPIWPAAGIALAAVLLFGKRVAPGIWLGSFLANVATTFDSSSAALLVKSMLLPAGLSTGATLQAIVGAVLIRRFVGYPATLLRESDVIKFLGLGGPVSCLVSASVGVSTLFLAGTLPALNYAFSWWTWWVGDTIGVLVVTPMVLTWLGQPDDVWRRRRKTVALPLCLALAIIMAIFIGTREQIIAAPHSLVAWTVLACGLALTGLLGAFLLVVSGNAVLFEQLVVQRTTELESTRQAEQALRERDARIRRLVESNIIGVVFWDMSGGISEANNAFLQLSGYSQQDLHTGALRWTDMTPPEYRAVDERAIEELKRTGTSTPVEKEYLRKDGSRVPVLIGGATFEGSQDKGVSFVLDLSARKQAEEQMRHMADHDALTGLPNRVLLQDRMQQAIVHAHRNQRRMAILFIDLDYFKDINDSLGHHIGDVVLQMASVRLQQCLREGDSLARLGGDEFVLILPVLNDSSDAARVAHKALDALAQPFIVKAHELHVSASIGISLYPDDGSDVETLMRTADTAMYHAKETGRGKFQFFTPALNEATQERLMVGARLRQALDHGEFVLHYQPQVDMESGAIFSAEALLRWQPPGTEPISCGDFIANAEESGLIVPIGTWALRQACKQLRIWHDAGYPALKIAVNISPRQLEQADFCNLVGQILDEVGIAASSLELEITESILLRRSEFNLATLTRLSGMGIQLSVDDFGTGYSSLAYLQRFPVHALKIDQSFVRGLGKDLNDAALVTAIIAMAASLHLEVVAEGVETSQQAMFLLAHGGRAGQGFYFSKAVPAETLSKLFRMHANLPLRAQPELRL